MEPSPGSDCVSGPRMPFVWVRARASGESADSLGRNLLVYRHLSGACSWVGLHVVIVLSVQQQ
jgi:hypothetical protein